MEGEQKVLLVIDGNAQNNWYEVFKGHKKTVRVEQTSWDLIDVTANATQVSVNIKPSPDPIFGTSQKYERTVTPDCMLVRNFVLGLHGKSYINSLMGLQLGNIPSVNSLISIFLSTQRALLIAELKRVEKTLGHDVFPLIPMKYYTNAEGHIHSSDIPCVVKVGTSHAGYGKMQFTSQSDFSDFSTLMAMYNDYITVEPFVKNVADIRIQKIGKHLRAYKRYSKAGWKGNVALSEVEDIPVTDTYKLWVAECEKAFGGLDILSIDAVVDEKGNHTILELNDTATGLNPNHAKEDTEYIRDLVLEKMNLLDKTTQQ